MGQFSKVLLVIDNAHTVPERALDCRPGLGWSTPLHHIHKLKGSDNEGRSSRPERFEL